MDLSPILIAREFEYVQKRGVRRCKVVVRRMPEQRRKRYKRRQVGMAIGRHTQIRAGHPVKHPRRNFQPTQHLGTAQIAAENNAVRLLSRLVNADPQTKPWMPWIKQFPKLGNVGVLKLCCTTPSDRIHRWDIGRRHRKPSARSGHL
jgi:hypothetical protein